NLPAKGAGHPPGSGETQGRSQILRLLQGLADGLAVAGDEPHRVMPCAETVVALPDKQATPIPREGHRPVVAKAIAKITCITRQDVRCDRLRTFHLQGAPATA